MRSIDKNIELWERGESNPSSHWFTPNMTSNPKSDLALPSGNTAEYMDTCIIPKGTTVIEGTVNSNFGQPGGGYNYYVLDPNVVYPK